MNASAGTDHFYAELPVFRDFTQIVDDANFRPLPDGWVVGVADVVQSTKAIQQNRYKAVNMAGAAVIVAITNALQGRDFPFVFGGDGASFAVAAVDADLARQALAETATWVKEDLDLALRIGMVSGRRHPRAWLRRPRRALCAVGEHFDCHVFRRRARLRRRGDEAWRDRRSAGAARRASRPHRPVLPLRAHSVAARAGAVAGGHAGAAREPQRIFRTVIEAVTRIVEKTPDASRPLPGQGLKFKWPPQGADLEARAARRAGESIRLRKLKVLAHDAARISRPAHRHPRRPLHPA